MFHYKLSKILNQKVQRIVLDEKRNGKKAPLIFTSCHSYTSLLCSIFNLFFKIFLTLNTHYLKNSNEKLKPFCISCEIFEQDMNCL